MDAIGMYEGYTHLLSMVICNAQVCEQAVLDVLEDLDSPCGVTRGDKGYVIIKALGKTAQKLQNVSESIKALLK
jgi:urease accessory protein UreH